ncbi:MAG: SGNH/GDSL hydrolase family protein [Verrucomicrobia bacterium]|nr:SGNH/GDSL hydrolase family protein [Verrucomicrobiota bacterium]
MRSAAAKVLLLTVTLLIGVSMMEWGVRRLFPYFSPTAQVPFRLVAKGMALGPAGQTVRMATPKGDYNSVLRFNQDGFRDTKTLAEVRDSDWYALGDSYTMGWGVEEEERFSNRLEQEFKAHNHPARVFNIALPDNIIGYGRLLRYAESRGAKVRRVVVGICMENDLRDYRDGKGAWDMMGLPPSSNKEAIREWLKKHSALYIAASYELQRLTFTRKLLNRLGIARSIDELTGHNEWDETVLGTSRDELVKLVAGRDALILIIPSRNLWHGAYIPTEQRVHETFIRMLRESGLSVLDVRPMIEASGDPLSCYFKTDPHWNARGHAIAGRELFKAIQDRTPK